MDRATLLSVLTAGAFFTTVLRAGNNSIKQEHKSKQKRNGAGNLVCEEIPRLPLYVQPMSLAEHLSQGTGAVVPHLNRLSELEAPANNPLPTRDFVF
jgi:hypothetical protein